MYTSNKGYPKLSCATGCLTQTGVLTVNKSKQLELLESPATTPCSLDAGIPTENRLPAPGSGSASGFSKLLVQLPMQRHVTPFGVLCGHWTIHTGLVAVAEGLG